MLFRSDSYIDLYHNKKYVLYGVVDADVTDTTLVRAGISYQDTKPRGALWGALPTFYTDGTTTRLDRAQSTAADWTRWNTTNLNLFGTLRQQIGERWSVTLNYNRLRNTNDTQLLYLYGNVDKATGAIEYSNPYKSIGVSVQDSFDGQVRGEVSLFGRDHELVLGALHSILNRHTDNYEAPLPWPTNVPLVGRAGAAVPEPNWGTTPIRNEQERIEQNGYYGALRLNLADPLKIIAGGRIASWHQTGFAWSGPSDYGDDNVFIPYLGALLDRSEEHTSELQSH